MESKTNLEEKGVGTSLPEWEKPSVEELDINAMTLQATSGSGSDGLMYS